MFILFISRSILTDVIHCTYTTVSVKEAFVENYCYTIGVFLTVEYGNVTDNVTGPSKEVEAFFEIHSIRPGEILLIGDSKSII